MKATLDMHDLALFATVVRSGSFTRAAELLQTQKAHVSRVITRLEADLNVRLLQRTTRSLTLTEAGRELYDRATALLAALDETRQAIERSQSEPQGVLRLTCGEEFGTLVVARWVVDFQKHFPKMRVEMELSNRIIDIVHEGFDVAIRVGALQDSRFAARKLGEITYGLYASPDYLRGRALPKSPTDLHSHDLISFSIGPAEWHLIRGKERAVIKAVPRFRANNNLAIREAAAGGLGVAVLPHFQAAPLVAEKALRPVLPGWGRTPAPVNAIFTPSRFMPLKLRLFIDHAVQACAATINVS